MTDKSIEICSRLHRRGDIGKEILAGPLLNKAQCLQDLGNFEGATEMINKVLLIQKETLGEMHSTTADTYESLALAYAQQDMTEDSIKAYANAIDICQTVLGDNSHTRIQGLMTNIILLNREKNARALNEQGLAMSAQCLQGNNRDAYSRNNEAQGTRIG